MAGESESKEGLKDGRRAHPLHPPSFRSTLTLSPTTNPFHQAFMTSHSAKSDAERFAKVLGISDDDPEAWKRFPLGAKKEEQTLLGAVRPSPLSLFLPGGRSRL